MRVRDGMKRPGHDLEETAFGSCARDGLWSLERKIDGRSKTSAKLDIWVASLALR